MTTRRTTTTTRSSSHEDTPIECIVRTLATSDHEQSCFFCPLTTRTVDRINAALLDVRARRRRAARRDDAVVVGICVGVARSRARVGIAHDAAGRRRPTTSSVRESPRPNALSLARAPERRRSRGGADVAALVRFLRRSLPGRHRGVRVREARAHSASVRAMRGLGTHRRRRGHRGEKGQVRVVRWIFTLGELVPVLIERSRERGTSSRAARADARLVRRRGERRGESARRRDRRARGRMID